MGVWSRMKRKIKWAVFICIVTALAGAYSVIDKNSAVYDKDVEKEEYAEVSLTEHEALTQAFVSGEDKLDGMNVKMSVSGNAEDAVVSFALVDEEGRKLAEGKQPLDRLKPGRFFTFGFDPVTDCRGKEYIFHLAVESCGEDTEIFVYNVPGTMERTGLSVGGEPVDGTLALRTINHRFDIETFIVTLCFLLYVILFMRWLARIFK